MRFAFLFFVFFAPCCFGQLLTFALSPDLDAFLGLTPQQVEEISRIKAPLDAATRSRLSEVNRLWKAVVDSISAPDLDPMRSGQPYAEALTIQAADAQERTLAANRIYGLLNPQQTAMLEALRQSHRIFPSANLAICEKLIPPADLRLFFLYPTLPQCLGDSLQSYMRQSLPMSIIPPPNLAKFLEINEDQRARVGEIRAKHNREIYDREIALFLQLSLFGAFSGRPPFDPMELGKQIVGMEKLRREIRQITQTMVAEVRGVFTPEQVEKLKSLEEARKLIRLEEEARCSGYLPRLEFPLEKDLYNAEVAHPFANKAYHDCTSSGIRRPPE